MSPRKKPSVYSAEEKYLDTEGRPVGMVAAYDHAGYKRAHSYLENTNPDSAIKHQYASRDEAQADMDRTLEKTRAHVAENLGAYVAQAEAEMALDHKLQAEGYYDKIDAMQAAAHANDAEHPQGPQ